jgi:hypothetical protein
MTRGGVRLDFRLGAALALDNLHLWTPHLLGRRILMFAPGEAVWWPNRCDGVHVFAGPPPCALGDWSGRWREGETWGADLLTLIARRRGCRPGQGLAWICRLAGVPVEALARPERGAA